MYVIVRSDGNIDHTTVHGLFGTVEDAEDACPADDEEYSYRICSLDNTADLA
jgi:hypothetical protein